MKNVFFAVLCFLSMEVRAQLSIQMYQVTDPYGRSLGRIEVWDSPLGTQYNVFDQSNYQINSFILQNTTPIYFAPGYYGSPSRSVYSSSGYAQRMERDRLRRKARELKKAEERTRPGYESDPMYR